MNKILNFILIYLLIDLSSEVNELFYCKNPSQLNDGQFLFTLKNTHLYLVKNNFLLIMYAYPYLQMKDANFDLISYRPFVSNIDYSLDDREIYGTLYEDQKNYIIYKGDETNQLECIKFDEPENIEKCDNVLDVDLKLDNRTELFYRRTVHDYTLNNEFYDGNFIFNILLEYDGYWLRDKGNFLLDTPRLYSEKKLNYLVKYSAFVKSIDNYIHLYEIDNNLNIHLSIIDWSLLNKTLKFNYLNTKTIKLTEFYGCFDKFDSLDQLKGIYYSNDSYYLILRHFKFIKIDVDLIELEFNLSKINYSTPNDIIFKNPNETLLLDINLSNHSRWTRILDNRLFIDFYNRLFTIDNLTEFEIQKSFIYYNFKCDYQSITILTINYCFNDKEYYRIQLIKDGRDNLIKRDLLFDHSINDNSTKYSIKSIFNSTSFSYNDVQRLLYLFIYNDSIVLMTQFNLILIEISNIEIKAGNDQLRLKNDQLIIKPNYLLDSVNLNSLANVSNNVTTDVSTDNLEFNFLFIFSTLFILICIVVILIRIKRKRQVYFKIHNLRYNFKNTDRFKKIVKKNSDIANHSNLDNHK